MADEMTPETELTYLVNQLSAEFDAACQERHNMGATQYGAFSFLGKDMMKEAMDEVIDLSNYARYAFIKLRMMQLQIQSHQQEFEAFREWMLAKQSEYTPDGGSHPDHGFSPNGG